MIADLRSDTVTRPTKAMLEAMCSAAVGDDVFGDDATVKKLETMAARMFGMEAALYCTSGTMTNQLAIKTHCSPGSEVICDALSHVYIFEGGGIASNSLSSVKPVHGDRGRISAEMVLQNINNPLDIHQPITRLVSLENTMNKGGGSIYNIEEIKKINAVCREKGLALHLDGARLFNALVETGEKPAEYGNIFDTISICLSKGLGCPVGSILLGSAEKIALARRYRKAIGGGWRQAGYMAACGIFALENNIARLKEDHIRAREIESILCRRSFVSEIFPVETNIVIVRVNPGTNPKLLVEKLAENGILCFVAGKDLIRFVTHLDFGDENLDFFRKSIDKV